MGRVHMYILLEQSGADQSRADQSAGLRKHLVGYVRHLNGVVTDPVI